MIFNTIIANSSSGGAEINGIINEYKVAAGESVSAGDFVEFVNGEATAPTATRIVTTAQSGRYAKAVLLGENKVFIAHSQTTSYTMYGVVCTVNDDGTFSSSTNTLLYGLTNSAAHDIGLVALDDSRVFITLRDDFSTDATTYALKGMVCTITTTNGVDTITAGEAVTLCSQSADDWDSGIWDIQAYLSAKVFALSSNRVFIVASYGNTYVNTANMECGLFEYLVCDITGTDITVTSHVILPDDDVTINSMGHYFDVVPDPFNSSGFIHAWFAVDPVYEIDDIGHGISIQYYRISVSSAGAITKTFGTMITPHAFGYFTEPMYRNMLEADGGYYQNSDIVCLSLCCLGDTLYVVYFVYESAFYFTVRVTADGIGAITIGSSTFTPMECCTWWLSRSFKLLPVNNRYILAVNGGGNSLGIFVFDTTESSLLCVNRFVAATTTNSGVGCKVAVPINNMSKVFVVYPYGSSYTLNARVVSDLVRLAKSNSCPFGVALNDGANGSTVRVVVPE